MLNEQLAVPGEEGRAAEAAMLTASAERELSAFLSAVMAQFGVREAHQSALEWIEELSSVPWPVDGSAPNWRQATVGASIRLSNRISASVVGLREQRMVLEVPL